MANDGLRGFPEYQATVTSGASVNYLAQATALTLPTSVGGANVAINPTADITVTLPSAAAMQPSYVTIKNLSSTYTLIINDNAGNYLFAIGPTAVYYIWAYSTATVAGQWACEVTPADVVTGAPSVLFGGKNSGAFNVGIARTIAPINSTQAISLYVLDKAAGTTSSSVISLYAQVVTNAAGVLTRGPAVLVTAAMHYSYKGATVEMLSATSGVIAYTDNNTYINVIPFTVSGTVITMGSPVFFASSTSAASAPSISALTSTTAIMSVGRSATIYSAIITVSNNVATVGTANTTLTDSASRNAVVCALSATTAAVIFSPSTANQIQACIYSISGTTITANTPVNVSTEAAPATYVTLCALSATSFFVAFYATAGNLSTNACTVSGTTITAGTEVVVITATTSISCTALSATQVLLAYCSSNIVKAVPVTISGTTTSSGSETVISTNFQPNKFSICALQTLAVGAPSASNSIICWPGSSTSPTKGGQYAVVVSGFLSSVSAPSYLFEQNINAFNNYLTPSMVALSATQLILLTYELTTTPNSAGVYSIVASLLTVSGTSYTVTNRVVVKANAELSSATVAATNCFSICAVSSTMAVVGYQISSGVYAATISLSSNTLSVGTELTVQSGATYNYTSITAMSSSLVVINWSAPTTSSNPTPLSISGTTLSVGTGAVVTTNSPIQTSIVALSATTGVLFNGSSAAFSCFPFSISGTTITMYPVTSNSPQINAVDSGSSYTNFYPVAISPTRVLVASSGTGLVALAVLEVKNNAAYNVSADNTTLQKNTNFPANSGQCVAVPFSATKGVVFVATTDKNMGNYGGPTAYIAPYTITNGVPVIGNPINVPTLVGGIGGCAAALLAAPTVGVPSGNKAALVYSSFGSGLGGTSNEAYEGRIYFTTGAIT